eukprot:scaffold3307_cov265-Pinguiococcus_pyrenoidosus.AAC.25
MLDSEDDDLAARLKELHHRRQESDLEGKIEAMQRRLSRLRQRHYGGKTENETRSFEANGRHRNLQDPLTEAEGARADYEEEDPEVAAASIIAEQGLPRRFRQARAGRVDALGDARRALFYASLTSSSDGATTNEAEAEAERRHGNDEEESLDEDENLSDSASDYEPVAFTLGGMESGGEHNKMPQTTVLVPSLDLTQIATDQS